MTRPTAPPAPTYLLGTCWNCGHHKYLRGDYCRDCTRRGLTSPWMNCSGCGCVKRRAYPGQDTFICIDCKPTERTTP